MEVLIIGCDRHPEVPVTVEIKTIKGGYSSCLVKRVLFDPYTHKVLPHIKSPKTAYTKDRLLKRLLNSAQNTVELQWLEH